MGYVVDAKKRLRVPKFKPGDTWQDTWADENHVTFTRLVPPPEPEPCTARLERDDTGILVVRGGPATSLADTRKALEEFP